jgi:hypothetical protein
MLDRNVVGEIRILLRLPLELRDALAELARRETRSLNGQIVHMLREALPADLAEQSARPKRKPRSR